MNKLETNALRIAELNGWQYQYTDRWTRIETYSKNEVTENSIELKRLYSSYNGLMPIVFESNNTDYEIHLYSSCVQLNTDDIQIFDYNTKPEFIEALQLACIKYLELKNG